MEAANQQAFSSLRERQAVAFRIRILEAMEGEGTVPGLEWLDHQFGATKIETYNYSPEAKAAATAFIDALPAVRAAILTAYQAVADFGLEALGEACDILADLQNDTQAEVEKENGLTHPALAPLPGQPSRAVVTTGPLGGHLAACAAAGIKGTNSFDLACNAATLGNAINRAIARSLAGGERVA